MSVIEVTRHHELDHDHAKATAESLAEDLASSFDVKYSWTGDKLHFERKGARGFLMVEPERIHVRLELGLMLRAFRPKIEKHIHKHLDKLLET